MVFGFLAVYRRSEFCSKNELSLPVFRQLEVRQWKEMMGSFRQNIHSNITNGT